MKERVRRERAERREDIEEGKSRREVELERHQAWRGSMIQSSSYS